MSGRERPLPAAKAAADDAGAATPPPAGTRRVGLREVARAAGVSVMSVSLSLRDSPKIAPETRRRVREIAVRLGYRPDPEVARLMDRLRSSRTARGSVVIALFDLWLDPGAADHPYNVGVRRGIVARADALGLGVSLFRLRDCDGDAGAMMRVVRSRGIVGGILLPSNEPVNLDPRIVWDGFSVVAATTSVITPRFHRVAPNQIHNVMTLIENMERRGYRRIGTVLSDSFEQRTAHYFSLVLTWRGHGERILILPNTASRAESNRLVTSWLKEHKPDVVLAQNTDDVAHLLGNKTLSAPSAIGLVSLSTRSDACIAYQDELPEHVGACAVSLLTGMMNNNDTGIPLHPQVTTVDGCFHGGKTVRGLGGTGAAD